MVSQDDDSQQRFALMIIFGLVAILVSSVIGVTVYQQRAAGTTTKVVPAVVVAAAAAPAGPASVAVAGTGTVAGAAQAASDAASVTVEQGLVKFYFASGQADLASGATEAMAEVIQGAKAGRKLVISGFHDATGDAAKNADLARVRAQKVRDALVAAGVADSQIMLKKPEQMEGSGSNAEARRVEIRLE